MSMGSAPSERTRVSRLAEYQHTDRSALEAVLDAGRVAHVAVVEAGQPFVLPMAYVRDGDRLLLHGSTGSRLMRALAQGVPTCVTVTMLDALVFARSAFESSMHYRCAMVLGRCQPVGDAEESLRRLTDGLLGGRTKEIRPSSRKELAATLILELPLAEWSVKINDGDPDDPPADLASDAWAGIVPVVTTYGDAKPAPDLRAGIPIPPSVHRMARHHAGA